LAQQFQESGISCVEKTLRAYASTTKRKSTVEDFWEKEKKRLLLDFKMVVGVFGRNSNEFINTMRPDWSQRCSNQQLEYGEAEIQKCSIPVGLGDKYQFWPSTRIFMVICCFEIVTEDK